VPRLEVGRKGRIFFFEKKKQKTFIRLVPYATVKFRTGPSLQSFFASFCSQKEESSLHLPSDLIDSRICEKLKI